MSRKEALQIGEIIADRWWHHNESTILAKQNIERRKAWEQKKLTTPASRSEYLTSILFEIIISQSVGHFKTMICDYIM